MRTCDVLVVGAGLAGLTVARLLAQRGLQVMLVDRRREVSESIRTTGIFVRRTWEDFPLPPVCLGPPIRRVVLYSPARRALCLESCRDEFRIGAMAELYEQYLTSAISAGVEWRGGHRFEGSRKAGNEQLVEFDHNGRLVELRVRYIIGADGARSRVAADLSLSRNRELLVGVEEVYRGIATSGPPALHCFFDPILAPGYIAWAADDGIEAHVGVAGYPQRFAPQAALGAFRDEALQMIGGESARFVERRSGLIPVGGILPRIVSRRGLLVGDAAGAVSPLTAGGLDPCLRQAALAARVTADFLATGAAESLFPYESPPFRRRFLVRTLLRRSLAQIRSPWLAELACTALRTRLFQPVARQVFFGRGSFPLEANNLDVRETLAYKLD